jgi:hypothetical protein
MSMIGHKKFSEKNEVDEAKYEKQTSYYLLNKNLQVGLNFSIVEISITTLKTSKKKKSTSFTK